MTDRERRSASRALQRYLVRFDDAGEMRLAFTQDISPEGLFLKTRFPPPPGAGLRLLIRTARGTRSRAGIVVWGRYNFGSRNDPSCASGVGIRFLGGVITVAGEA